MNEQQHLLAETVEPLFEGLGATATVEAQWGEIQAIALDTLLIPEAQGGFGGTWDDALLVFRSAGYHAVALPVVEAVLAARYRPADADGFGSVAGAAEGSVEGGVFTGSLSAVPWGRHAGWVLAAIGDRAVSIATASAECVPSANIAGEPRDTLRLVGANVIETDMTAEALLAEIAIARVAQMAGALDAALGRSVRYANERVQFGRPLSKFQAVQQNLATFATEAAAVNCAAMGAFQALARGDAFYEAAAAKLRANIAVGIGTAIAHQAHGAIGFTEEFGLHHLTTRLWSWRSEFGGDRVWADRLGTSVAASGDRFWADMVARSDPAIA